MSPHPAHESGLTCIHARDGLCPDCATEFDEDPMAYHEFGAHPAGIARMAELDREMSEREPEAPCDDMEGIPF